MGSQATRLKAVSLHRPSLTQSRFPILFVEFEAQPLPVEPKILPKPPHQNTRPDS